MNKMAAKIKRKHFKKSRGFTLIETLLAIILVVILVTIVVLIINPQTQLKKARDAKRKDDLSGIAQVLGRYVLDKGAYPLSTQDYQMSGAPWGAPFQPYLTTVPKDPLSPSQSYAYYSDGHSYQIFAKLEIDDPKGCGSCGPGGGYDWAVTSSGTTATTLPPPPTPSPVPSPTPTPTPAPTATPPPHHFSGDLTVSISSPDNPKMTKAVLSPFDPELNQNQTISLYVQDTSNTPITQASVDVTTDHGTNTYQMSLQSGSNTNGIWATTFSATDTHDTHYSIILTAKNQNGLTTQDEDPLELSLQNLRNL